MFDIKLPSGAPSKPVDAPSAPSGNKNVAQEANNNNEDSIVKPRSVAQNHGESLSEADVNTALDALQEATDTWNTQENTDEPLPTDESVPPEQEEIDENKIENHEKEMELLDAKSTLLKIDNFKKEGISSESDLTEYLEKQGFSKAIAEKTIKEVFKDSDFIKNPTDQDLSSLITGKKEDLKKEIACLMNTLYSTNSKEEIENYLKNNDYKGLTEILNEIENADRPEYPSASAPDENTPVNEPNSSNDFNVSAPNENTPDTEPNSSNDFNISAPEQGNTQPQGSMEQQENVQSQENPAYEYSNNQVSEPFETEEFID